jgi:ABC-type branched-subunit amino acid transport system ATPase component/predicted flap endonuclease-1-like 5' DNA nuclease
MATAPMDTILKVEHLSMKFGGLVAVGDLSFEAKRGEITALIGPNGAGKTTVFNCITGFYKPSEGMISLMRGDGTTYLLERLPDFQIPAKAKVARTFQNIRLFSGMTLFENLLVAQHNKLMDASGFTVLGLLGIGKYRKASAESRDLAEFWLEKADLIDRADDPAGDLSYGAQRRLEIARAMCTGPELLCLDEPAAGLNPKESAALNKLLMGIKNDTGTSILLIEHDMSVVMQISDHVVVLEYGRKISDGDPSFVKNDPKVIAAYLGVDDEEVENVLVEVGDEHVIEQLDGTPDPQHGPGASSSMMAGPVSDSIEHASDGEGLVKVAPGASKADRVKPTAASKPAEAKPAAKKAAPKASAATKPASLMSAPPPASAAPAKLKPKPAPKAAASPAKPVAAKADAKPVAAKPAPAAKVAKPAGKAATPPAKPAAPNAAKPAAAKATPPAAKAAPVAPAAPDDLTLIKGIGPVNARKLKEHGVTTFAQMAAWKKADIVAAEAYLEFDGRIAREDWIGQAKGFAKASKAKPAKAGPAKSGPAKTGGRG